ncbi:MAG TPA: S41 family peptidase [Candidatus Dormibacteraeota bacterium]|nr:S41 family peptidase [Candidatus Dormibacteraeota bacterium]
MRTLARTRKNGSARTTALANQLKKYALILVAIFLFVPASLGHGFAQATIPDTPAGKVLHAWLDAFNSGDRTKIEAYVKTFDPKESADFMLTFHNQTGGFDLLAIESSEPKLIKFRVKEKASPTVAIGSIQLNDAQPPTIENFGIRAIPPGAVVENIKLDAAARQRVLDGVESNLKESYVYAETAKKMNDDLRERQKRGEFDAVTDGDVFAALLTKDLQAVSHDKHLHVDYSPYKLPNRDNKNDEPTPEEKEMRRKQAERANCGFVKAEILTGNIGYLKFNFFANPEFCGATAIAAMNFLAHVNAIIFDLRDNGGGDPDMIALISTYLFNKPTHLNDLYNRKEDETTQHWTLPYVPGNRLPDAPAFVLTSKMTFSGAEEFSYNLKNLKRATIVGETTGGGAHPVSGHRIDDHFMIGVPFARAVNPVSKTNWEGTGVAPDVPANSAEALDVAEKLATEKIQSK